ncbi:hypothetical protein E2562_038152 [Oryza meyeriana var. granulata]|uniref:Uncharacterized protein n=1 Tax=Oryza meyeriana var. granulata TaxID=110450 RepID=A0A6G1CXE8_9ORYZ|nr:hypothetical protein E2562_038152 [Oryza meyeriana var. granulata]
MSLVVRSRRGQCLHIRRLRRKVETEVPCRGHSHLLVCPGTTSIRCAAYPYPPGAVLDDGAAGTIASRLRRPPSDLATWSSVVPDPTAASSGGIRSGVDRR